MNAVQTLNLILYTSYNHYVYKMTRQTNTLSIQEALHRLWVNQQSRFMIGLKRLKKSFNFVDFKDQSSQYKWI